MLFEVSNWWGAGEEAEALFFQSKFIELSIIIRWKYFSVGGDFSYVFFLTLHYFQEEAVAGFVSRMNKYKV